MLEFALILLILSIHANWKATKLDTETDDPDHGQDEGEEV